LTCVGALNPGIGSVEEMSTAEIINTINSSNADFIVVSLGAKKGQAWILENLSKLNTPVVSHLGAVVNFVEGGVVRAPKLMQKAGLEWLWRIKEEPLLWKRYFFDGTQLIQILLSKVVPYAYFDRKTRKNLKAPSSFNLQIDKTEEEISIRWEGSATKDNLKNHRHSLSQIATASVNQVSLNLSEVEYIDPSSLGLITLLEKHLGNKFRISSASEVAINILRFNQMERLITLR